ncbi:MAG: PAS domain-containing sensor histidine kinase [Acidobacteria bacterium]|nr:PAS domain-containing sensor histidine kinase [Acidobacteriota bacterium]
MSPLEALAAGVSTWEDDQDAFEDAPFGYLYANPQGRILRANVKLHRWLGEQPGALTSSCFADLLSPGGRIFAETHLWPLLRLNGYFHEVALELMPGEGPTLPVFVSAVAVRDASGRAIFCRIAFTRGLHRRIFERELLAAKQQAEAIAIDLRQRHQELAALHQQLAAEKLRLLELHQEKNRLLGMAAHDLRGPLGAIGTLAELVMDDSTSTLSAESQEFLSLARQSSEQMLRLVNDLLDVAKIESGIVRLNRQSTHLPELVETALPMLRSLAQGKGIPVHFQTLGPMPVVNIDRGKVLQVLNNLLTNAIKFSYPGSPVELTLRATSADVVMAVRDRGQGIPQSEIGKLFRPFQTTSVRGTANEPSHGLGLAIVKKMVLEHGGRIEVESEVGRGSVFTVTLPLAGSSDSRTPAESPNAAPSTTVAV